MLQCCVPLRSSLKETQYSSEHDTLYDRDLTLCFACVTTYTCFQYVYTQILKPVVCNRKYFECRYKERAGSRVHVDHCIDRYTRLRLHFRPSIADYGRHYGGQDRARVDIRNDRATLPVFYLRPISDNQTVPQMAMGSQEILHASAARSATAVSGR